MPSELVPDLVARVVPRGEIRGTVVDTAKLGLKSLAVGAVGDDEKADWVLLTLNKHGVDTSAMQRLKGVPTSATILNVRPNGDRPALHVRGASDHFDVAPAMYDQVFDAPDAVKAYQRLEGGEQFGKVVLRWAEG